jgi:hypothetical protein
VFKWACKVRDCGFREAEVAAAVLALNAECCDPPLEEAEVRASVRAAMKYEAPQTQLTAEEEAALVRFQTNTNLIDELAADLAAAGIVGERNVALALYMVGTSRLLPQPLHAIVGAPSSAGKTYLVERVRSLFPEAAVVEAMRITPEALSFWKSKLSHRLLVSGERKRVQDDAVADSGAMLRQFRSEGRFSKMVPQQVDGESVSRLLVIEGPVASMETTTVPRAQIFKEDANRALFLRVDDSHVQTRAILNELGERHRGHSATTVDPALIRKHHAFQERLEALPVVIPYADDLLAGIPDTKLEVRRAASQVLAMVQAITLLHQHQRERDADGYLLAKPSDYRLARELLLVPLSASVGVSPGAAALYQQIAGWYGDGPFGWPDVEQRAGGCRAFVYQQLHELAEQGCFVAVRPARGNRAALWRLGADPLEALLPRAARVCANTQRRAQ